MGSRNHILAFTNYVQVGSQSGDGLCIASPHFDLRYDQSFPLAKLVARAPTGMIEPDERMAELERIRNQQRRFPVWVTARLPAAQDLFVSRRADREPAGRMGTAARRVPVYGLGAMWYFGPPTSFLPWML